MTTDRSFAKASTKLIDADPSPNLPDWTWKAQMQRELSLLVDEVTPNQDDQWAKKAKGLVSGRHNRVKAQEWYIECSLQGNEILKECIEINPHKRAGMPVLFGTRFTAAQILAELADSAGPSEVADDFDLDESKIKSFLRGLSLIFGRPYGK